jgi:ketosteroid isomerase-like protein
VTGDEAKRIVAPAFAAFADGNPSLFVGLLAPDVRYTLIGSTAVSGTFEGLDEVTARLFGPLQAALAGPLAIRAHRLTAEEDRVVVEGKGRAVLRSGAPYEQTYCFVFRLARGRIAEVVEYVDTHLVARAFDVPAKREALLHRMDLNMWEMFREGSRLSRGTDVLDMQGLTLIRSPRGSFFHNSVMVRESVVLRDVLTLVRETHVARGLPFSIWTRAHADAPLEAALAAAGFRTEIVMPAMALLGDPGTVPAAEGLEIRAVVNDALRRDFARVTIETFGQLGTPPEIVEEAFESLVALRAPHIQGFVGYAKNEPVTAAAVYVSHGVAGIGWVGTVAEARRRHYAEAVTWAAVREGFRRGAAFATLQASQMGRPVYERMGFVTPSEYRVWTGPGRQ